ncbi:MAG: hypothetical protein JRN21_10025 [Nitrososphaerota archaeon]|nr:hypothetical protein [Nitrososphaerota archaeon]
MTATMKIKMLFDIILHGGYGFECGGYYKETRYHKNFGTHFIEREDAHKLTCGARLASKMGFP